MSIYKNLLRCWAVFLLLGTLETMGQTLTGLETREPAYLLRPRHFNPHPYAGSSSAAALQSQKFFYNPPPQLPFYHLVPYSPLATATQAANALSSDQHPYNIIKGHRDFQNRIPTETDSQAYSALAKHAQKVLSNVNFEEENAVNRKYEFAYTANDIYHAQQQDDQGLVKGSYEVPLPDGRVQVVSYTADDNGYHPEISYRGEAAGSVAVQQHQPTTAAYPSLQAGIPSYPIPATPSAQRRGSVVVYPPEEEDDEEQPPPAPQSYYSRTTTLNRPHAVQYNNYGLYTGTSPANTVASKGHIQYATYENADAANTYVQK